jgi:hypothetical protein
MLLKQNLRGECRPEIGIPGPDQFNRILADTCVQGREAVFREELCVCPEVSDLVEMSCFPDTRCDAEAWLKFLFADNPIETCELTFELSG